MGLIVNKPMGGTELPQLLDQLSIPHDENSRKMPLRFGGPVEGGRGFVLHSAEHRSDLATLPVSKSFSMTATIDILEELAGGKGPEKALMALGYAGWGPGQLEGEIADNGWLFCQAESEIVFDLPDSEKWEAALNTMGIDPMLLSADAGRA